MSTLCKKALELLIKKLGTELGKNRNSMQFYVVNLECNTRIHLVVILYKMMNPFIYIIYIKVIVAAARKCVAF